MDKDKKKKFISGMLLYCLSGDLAVRINYGGILISRVENYLTDEVILKDAHHTFLIKILKSLESTVTSLIIAKMQKPLSSQDIEQLKDIVVEKTFPIDPSWGSKEALAGIESLGDLGDIRTARYHFYAAADYYPASNTSAAALSGAIKSMDRALQKVVDICERHDLMEFGAEEWRENVTIGKTATAEE